MAGMMFGKRAQRYIREHSLLQRIIWYVEALLMNVFWSFMRLLGPDRASASGAWLLSRIGPRLAKNRHVRANHAVVFPDMSAAQRMELARKAWGNVGSVLAEYPHLLKIASDPARLEVVNVEILHNFRDTGQPVVLVTPHLGNWELTRLVVQQAGLQMAAVYSPQQNPFLDEKVKFFRGSGNQALISGKGGAGDIYKVLSSDLSLGLLPDQRADGSTMVPFFGVPAQTTPAPARFALSSGRPLVPFRTERIGGAHFRVTIYPPIEAGDRSVPKRERALRMTGQLNTLFEEWIRERPEQWLCAKRRWPKTPDYPRT